ncbi:unnamed protein product [Phytophthora lilii]|uniref:Unnamed protein product n=1 Tax=Phytophthora lilii TaxID=2077276 RepID=A0A9W6TFD5_9STRA|nr:unnamed protein product [Phytophthora lilii]
MQSMRMSALLMELSSVSSAFHSGRSSPLQLTVSSSLNGGIGPTPKPIFVELIYDYFLEKFGTRCEAERIIHDVFSNCRSLVRTDSLALLFSYLCCMSNSCPEDRLLGQNEALAFLHAIFRCGLHNFRLVNPVPMLPTEIPGTDSTSTSSADSPQDDAEDAPQTASSVAGQTDFVRIDVAETILQTAFSKLSADQKIRLRLRTVEAASDGKSVAPPSEMEANAFLVFALHEWRRYILHRLNEIRVTCCAVEEELAQFEELLQLETIASILQKTGIAYTSEDLCVIFRRLYITEKAPTKCNDGNEASSATPTTDPMSDRIAAACFPLVAREALSELQVLEHATARPFEIRPSPLQSYEFLVSTWGDYQEPCSELLEELRQIGKSNDIQAKALSRWPATNIAGKTGGGGDVLYLSSSSSSNTVSSQDVAQLEAVHMLFLDKLQRLTDIFDNSTQQKRAALSEATGSQRRSSINVKRDGSLLLVDEVNAQETMVNETWKVFRQMFVGFVKLRAVARIGKGALPDQWEACNA